MLSMQPKVRPAYVALATIFAVTLFLLSHYAASSMRAEPTRLIPASRQAVAKVRAETGAALAMALSRPQDRVSGLDSHSCFGRQKYPVDAIRHHHEGTAVLRILVAPGGNARQIEIQKSSGFAELDKAAARAANCWQFKPKQFEPDENEAAFDAWIIVPVQFSISQE